MNHAPTSPSISESQNTARALTLLAAQRRLYSDAKTIQSARFAVVTIGATLSITVALLVPDARVLIGVLTACALLLIGLLGGGREKRRVTQAASIQEEFDCLVFSLPWNRMLSEQPSPTIMAEASRRGKPDGLADWYPDTGTTIRPLDVLICQRSNVSWGASLHRFWAAVLTGLATAIIVVALLLGWYLGLSFSDVLAAIIAPLLAPLREIFEMVRTNHEAATSKTSTENKILDLWRKALEDPVAVRDKECRSVQDRILILRQSNASVPDWVHRLRRETQEGVMRLSSDYLIEEAKRHNLA